MYNEVDDTQGKEFIYRIIELEMLSLVNAQSFHTWNKRGWLDSSLVSIMWDILTEEEQQEHLLNLLTEEKD